MFTYLLQSSVCLIILYGVYHFILSELTFFKYNRIYLLISILVSLMIPILAPLLVLSEESVPVLHWSHLAGDITYIVADNEVSVFDWEAMMVNVLWVIYIVGIIVVMLKMMYGLSKIFRYYQQGQKEDFNGYRIITTEAVHLPFSFFKGIYVSRHVPLQDHIHTILEHEEIHIRQWHTVDVLLAEMVHAFFWFNPVMIFYKRALRQAHEFLADDLICRKNSVSSYTELLLSKSQSGLELALTNQFFHSQIKKRIIMMTKNKTNVLSLWKYALALPMIGVLFITFSCKESVNSTSISESAKDTTIESKKTEDPDYTDLEKQNILIRAEEMPRFPGCEEIADLKERNTCSEQKLLQYIYSNLKYPKEARLAGIAGQCVAKFIVNTEGKIQDIRILRDIGGGCGESVKQVLLSTNDMSTSWIPGKQSGKSVNVVYTLPVKFALADDEKSIGMNDNTNSKDSNQSLVRIKKSDAKYSRRIGDLSSSKPNLKAKNEQDVSLVVPGITPNIKTYYKGEVIVQHDNKTLAEGEDYEMNYSTGKLKILDPNIKNDQIVVKFKSSESQNEDNSLDEDKGYYSDQQDKSLQIINAAFNKDIKNKPLFLIDGVETDIEYLKDKSFKAKSVIVNLPISSVAIYGEKAKFGSLEMIEPVFTLKN